MNIVSDIKEWQQIRNNLRNKTIGFVPTMGNLHAGHLSLCTRAQNENDITVVSIFVNPTQFNEANDFALYPRTLTEDQALLSAQKIDYLFLPASQAIYPDDYEVQVSEKTISTDLEGTFRPGHFNGMMTIVLKLLNLITATRAYFGEKDYQQFLLIKKMAKAFFLPTEIISCATVRAEDGLALSSRNLRLSPAQRECAKHFPRLLQTRAMPDEISKELELHGFKVDYVADKWGRRLAAVWLGEVRLIDNIAIDNIAIDTLNHF